MQPLAPVPRVNCITSGKLSCTLLQLLCYTLLRTGAVRATVIYHLLLLRRLLLLPDSLHQLARKVEDLQCVPATRMWHLYTVTRAATRTLGGVSHSANL